MSSTFGEVAVLKITCILSMYWSERSVSHVGLQSTCCEMIVTAALSNITQTAVFVLTFTFWGNGRDIVVEKSSYICLFFVSAQNILSM